MVETFPVQLPVTLISDDPVRVPADVIVPVPVVDMFAEVEIFPLAVIDVTPVKAPALDTFNPEEFREKVSSVALPMVIVFAATPVPIFIAPVVPESRVIEEDVVEEIVPAPAKVKAVAEVAIVSIEATPVRAPPVVTFNPPLEASANVPVELPTVTFPVPVVAIVTLLAPAVAIFVAPVEDNVVNAPVDAVVAPIAVLFIPVAVVLKCPEVNVMSFAPEFIEEALKPERAKAPEVAVKLSAPVVRVKPFDAVSDPAEIIVPVPVVEIFPEVVMSFVVEIVPNPAPIEPEESAPTAVSEEVTTFEARVVPEMLAAAFTVIEELGNVIVREAVGSVIAKVVLFASAVTPSKTRGEAPSSVALPNESVPEVAVKLRAPVVRVRPFDAVKV